MLPFHRNRIEYQLVRWGYPRRIVENMKPWRLLDCYHNEKKKREFKTINKVLLLNKYDISESDDQFQLLKWLVISRNYQQP